MEGCFLVAGLGNPGPRYAGTRHNAGFMLAEQVVAQARGAWQTQDRFRARIARCRLGGEAVLVCEPLTFMNASGEAVGAVLRYHRISLDRLLVLVDDADLRLGQLRLRPEGSSGGHHGLESIEQVLGSKRFARLRLGIGRQPDGRRAITGHVLGDFAGPERECFERVLERAAAQVVCWIADGIGPAMNRFNGAVDAPDIEG